MISIYFVSERIEKNQQDENPRSGANRFKIGRLVL
jgi:hypothetical protein